MILRSSNRTSRGHRPAGGRLGAGLRRRAVCAAAAAACLFAAAFTGGCTRDLTDTGGFEPRPDAGGDYATLQLVVPGVASAQTRAAEVKQETLIEAGKLHVLLYAKNEEDNWQFVTVASPQEDDISEPNVAGDGYATYSIRIPFPDGNLDRTFRAGLVSGLTLDEVKKQGGYTMTDEGEQWSVFAGCTTDDEGNRVENPLTEARINLTFATAGKWPVPTNTKEDFRPFPMWGESPEAFVLRPGATIAGTIRMTRAVARVDVGVNFKKDADGHFPLNDMQAQGLYKEGRGTYFELETVSVYRTATGGVCGASKDNINTDTGQVKDITLSGMYATFGDDAPLSYTLDDGELTTPANPGADAGADLSNQRCLTRQCYVPETENHGLEFDDAACIVVGGKYGSATAKTTYYRIDFAVKNPDPDGGGELKPTPDSRIDLLRNHAYVVNITSIAGHGENSEQEALKNQNTNLTAEVVDWDQSQQVGDIVTDGVYTLSVDRSEQKYYCDGTAETFTVKTDYDGELGRGWKLKIEGDEDFTKNIRYYDAKGTAHAPGSPGWPATGQVGTTELSFGMEELENNADGSERTREGRLVFEAGRMKTQVRITQSSRDLLRILFDPEELYFGPTGDAKSVEITVTTKKKYTLTVAGTAADGTKYEQQIYPTQAGTIPDDRFLTFFKSKKATPTVYDLLPTDNTDQPDRQFTFEVTATLTDAPQAGSVTERFDVYQVKEPVSWKIVSVANAELRENPWEVVVANTATQVQPKIETSPGSLIWWFSKGGSSTGDDTWITNLQSWIGKKIENIGDNYKDGFLFTMTQNTGLSRRSVTLQAESNTPGLSRKESQLVITQKGAPLKLRPSTQGGDKVTLKSEPGNGQPGVYMLDHGTGLTGGKYTLDMTANTDWYWYWNKDDADVFAANYALLIQNDWTATPGDNTVTTNGPKDGKSEKTWYGVASFTVPNFTAARPDDLTQENRDTPLGGRRTVVRELRNSNPQLTDADVQDNARQLHITRELPAFTNIVKWPFQDMSSLNLAKEEGEYDDATFEVLSNAPVKLVLWAGATEKEQNVKLGEVACSPTQGYQRWSQIFAAMPNMPEVTDESKYDFATYYKLAFEGLNQPADGQPNTALNEHNIYYTGYDLRAPLRNMEKGQHYLSSASHDLKLDFSNSRFTEMDIRVLARLVNTDGTTDGVDDYFAKLADQSEDMAKEKRLYPAADWENGHHLRSDDESKLIEFTLGENKHTNMMYRVIVQSKIKAPDGSFEWSDLEELYIYQDCAGLGTNKTVWRYSPSTSKTPSHLNIRTMWREGEFSVWIGDSKAPTSDVVNADKNTSLWYMISPLYYETKVTTTYLDIAGTFATAEKCAAVSTDVTAPTADPLVTGTAKIRVQIMQAHDASSPNDYNIPVFNSSVHNIDIKCKMSDPYVYAQYGWAGGVAEYCRCDQEGSRMTCRADYSITFYNNAAGMGFQNVQDRHDETVNCNSRKAVAAWYSWSTMRIQSVIYPDELQFTRKWGVVNTGVSVPDAKTVGEYVDRAWCAGIQNEGKGAWRGHYYEPDQSNVPIVKLLAAGDWGSLLTTSMAEHVNETYSVHCEQTDAMYRKSSEAGCTSTLNEQ